MFHGTRNDVVDDDIETFIDLKTISSELWITYILQGSFIIRRKKWIYVFLYFWL